MKKRLDRPMEGIHVYALLFAIIILATILTWIIPAGEFDKVVLEATGQKVYAAGTYHGVDSAHQTPWDIFNALYNGCVSAGSQIFVIFFMGAWVKILEDSKLIAKSFSRLTTVFRGKEKVVVLIVSIIFTALGAVGINPTVPLTPLVALLAYSMGYDGAVAIAMTVLANAAGYGMGSFNVLSIGVAQELAELPRFSGAGVRMVIHIIAFVMLCIFLMRYIKKCEKDPAASITYGQEQTVSAEATSTEPMNVGDWLNVLVFVGGFAVIIYGVTKLNWSMAQYGPVFLVMAVLTGAFGGLGINGTARSFVKGCEKMAYAAIIVGIAKAISIILTNGKIIDTIVYALSIPIGVVGPVLGAVFMFIANSFINLFIPSASGQATTVMPLMVPVADLSGITRQVAVEAFQLGDGLTNVLIPTSTSLFVCLGICGVRYDKYVKWMMPWFIAINILGAVALVVLQLIQWG